MKSRGSPGKGRLQSRFLTFGKLVLLAGILVAAFVFSMILGMRLAVRGQVLETPALVGMSLNDAQQLFQQLELELAVDGRRFDSMAPPETIISQAPDPGVGIKANREVRVIISLGRRTASIPDLKGNSVRAARMMAEQNGFEIGMITEIAASGDGDEVVDQFPHPEAGENLDDQIDVLVLKQKAKAFIMPDLTGQNLNRVLMALKDNGFEARIFYRSHSDQRRGAVVRQFPEPGYLLREGELVNLEVAR